MEYSEYIADGTVGKAKAAAYKSHIIKNIEVIGQRKLVIIAGEEEYRMLNSVIAQLRTKHVHVPEVAFRVEIMQSAEEDAKHFDELKGRANVYYVLIAAPCSAAEIQLAAMSGIPGASAEIAAALRAECGFTERDYCEIGVPAGFGISQSMANMKASGGINSAAKRAAGMESATAAQLTACKDKMNGKRCFILGCHGIKLDELNNLMNEYTFAANDFCDFFAKTPQRPRFYLLTQSSSYLGNGKYIEGMESFINGDVKVFEEKFKKKPVYLNPLGNGLISGLPSFETVNAVYGTAKILPLYEMLQLALYMGYSEIFVYGYDGLFDREIDDNGIGRFVPEGKAVGFPAPARRLLENVRRYAEGHGCTIYTMCETEGLAMFDKKKYDEIDFSATSIFSRI